MNSTTEATPTLPHVSFSEMSMVTFSWLDFTLFSALLGLSALIGLYYGCCRPKQNTTDEYLMGGKSMRPFPVAMSLVASNVSAVSLLSVPADVYKFGAVYVWISLVIVVTTILAFYVFLSVFLELELTSTYEYLNLRFDNKVRVMASLIMIIQIVLYNPIVIYVPALAFAQATGVHLRIIAPIVCIICIFYTTVGGLRGVVWTDFLLTIAMVVSITVVFYLGTTSVGGFGTVLEKSSEGHRLDIFNFDMDITSRDSVWIFVMGASLVWITGVGLSQSTLQRLRAVGTINTARNTMLIFCIGILFVNCISVLTGLIIYTKYADCDLLSTRQISKTDQLLPYYVMDVAGNIPGLPGIFIAGVFSAGLSTLSTTLNSLSAIIYADFLPFFVSERTREKHTEIILKSIVVIFGTISTLLVFIVEHSGGILQLAVNVTSISAAPLLGLFSLGMIFPKANAKGALCGAVGGLILITCLVFGNKYYDSIGMLKDFSKPVSTEGCKFYLNTTITNDVAPPNEDMAPFVFRIIFWFHAVIGAIIVVIIGLVVSWFTNDNDPPVRPELITPIIRSWMMNKSQDLPPKYSSVEAAQKRVNH